MKVIIFEANDTDAVLYREIMEFALRHKEKIEVISSCTAPLISYPGLSINCEQKQVFRGNKEILLTHHEYSLLYLLACRAGQVISKEILFHAVWGKSSESTIKAVANTISNLRGKVEPDRRRPIYIQTALGGYRFNPDGSAAGSI